MSNPQQHEQDHLHEKDDEREYHISSSPLLPIDKVNECKLYWRNLMQSSSSNSLLQNASYFRQHPEYAIGDYLGFPSYYHAEAFYNYCPDKLDTLNVWSFLQKTDQFTSEIKQFKEKIMKMSILELIDMAEKDNAKKLAELTSNVQEVYYKYIPAILIHGRYTPQNAAYLLYHWLNYVDQKMQELKNDEYESLVFAKSMLIQKLKRALVWRTYCDGKLEDFLQSDEQKDPQLIASWMKDSFKPLIGFPKVKLEVVNKILTEAEVPALDEKVDLKSLSDYYVLLNRLESLCGVNEHSVVSYRERKRSSSKKDDNNYYYYGPKKHNTLTAVYKGLNHKERKEKLHKSLHHFRKYNRVLLVAGKLRGRLSRFFDAYVTGLCARIDKSGMITQTFSPEYYLFENDIKTLVSEDSKFDILTVLFGCMAVSEFSVRKAFTIESQMQGGLDELLSYLLTLMRGREEQTKWEIVGSVFPVEDIMNRMNEETKSCLLAQFLSIQIPIAKFLESQWLKGVDKCTQKDMMVPRRGTTEINTSGWNAASGAWNNAIRFIRAISKSMGQEAPLIMKCMKLTAADQMRWAQMAGKEEPDDVPVFKKLTLEKHITPWGIVLETVKATKEDIISACKECNVDPKKWLGYAQERSTESKIHQDMICGCVVPNVASVQMLLKSLGAFGYKPQPHEQQQQ
ncbi:hypothetical protein FDP41_012010 [Naegleria fowleri]|uniref:Uncharacterized protein n=1 Tax=Naegleria fowleri TaxID=5763 RepID=A0A6A5CA55_NAEFO|nr:uncharacterized protein FDP41_012010 [Naegleria fowleri]KAF0982149.1 hypothetical protein FDP41_012010 [Naegleria fowleri]CAG4713811.1 unnamed protein product [Naegleria fowleri]